MANLLCQTCSAQMENVGEGVKGAVIETYFRCPVCEQKGRKAPTITITRAKPSQPLPYVHDIKAEPVVSAVQTPSPTPPVQPIPSTALTEPVQLQRFEGQAQIIIPRGHMSEQSPDEPIPPYRMTQLERKIDRAQRRLDRLLTLQYQAASHPVKGPPDAEESADDDPTGGDGPVPEGEVDPDAPEDEEEDGIEPEAWKPEEKA